MSLLKSIHRLKQVDFLIKRKATGTSVEFASRIGISRSTLMENLRVMKELGADIYFCPHSRSYLYAKDFNFFIGSTTDKKQPENETQHSNVFSV